jgi:hypothetical protein
MTPIGNFKHTIHDVPWNILPCAMYGILLFVRYLYIYTYIQREREGERERYSSGHRMMFIPNG